MDARLLDLLNKSRLQELAQPEEKQTANLWLGYLFALLGGVVGLFMGWHLATAKKTLPNGERVYVYRERDRQHGKWILGLSIVILLVWILPLRGRIGWF